jgi:hypothetical protein
VLALHIGPHKTATSYIQRNFDLNGKALLKAGWLYPGVGTLDRKAHHDLARNWDIYLQPDGASFDALSALPRSLGRGVRNMVFSAEGFCRWTPERFRRLAEVLRDDELHLVYVVRDPLDIFYSYWAEEVKQGYSVSLPVRFTENFNDPFRSRLLNPQIDLSRYLKIENVRLHVVLFDELKRTKRDIFEYVAIEVLNIAGVTVQSTRRANQSYPVELTEFLRMLTARKAQGTRQIGSDLRNAFLATSTAEERHDISNAVYARAPDAMRAINVPRQSNYMRTLERQLRRRFSACFAPAEPQGSLFGEEPALLRYYDEHQLLRDPEIVDLLDEYEQRIDALPGSVAGG